MSYESYQQHPTSHTEEQRELVSQLRGIRMTLIVGLAVLMIALAPWWLIGMGILVAEAGMMGGD
jgi:triosephosphate isomerase